MKYLIAGLGNIGSQYAHTRHNIGFDVVDQIAKTKEATFKTDTHAMVAEIKHKGKTFVLIKPTTYMNLSGKAVRYWLTKHNIPTDNLLVVVDELALPLSTIRLRGKGSDGGHNGLKDIDLLLKTNQYARLRVGIGNNFPPGRQADYVLSKWTAEEEKVLPEIVERSAEAALAFGTIGLAFAMNQFNK
jgi:PTH1 family peptidyl-tRNA hydrolase